MCICHVGLEGNGARREAHLIEKGLLHDRMTMHILVIQCGDAAATFSLHPIETANAMRRVTIRSQMQRKQRSDRRYEIRSR
jgi:hypothetical protein